MLGEPPKNKALIVLPQIVTMAAVVGTLLYVPLGLAVALACWLTGISFIGLATFSGALNLAVGFLVWWLFAFAVAAVYAVCVFP